MHASTWHRIPRSWARAAMSAMGSTTPWGYDGAEPTTMMVESVQASASALTSTRKSAPTGTRTSSTSK